MIGRLIPALLLAASVFAQAPPAKSLLGTVSAFRPNSAEFEVKPDTGDTIAVKVSSDTILKRIAPGQTDLAKAESINATDVSIGDRVLVTFGAPDPAEARRIVVIPATDIAKKEAADRADWQKRGAAGVVTAVSGNDISVELRSLAGAMKFTVTAGPKTSFKRYAPDSIRFADAKNSSFAEIGVGDQLRARGEKSQDGTKIAAEDIVFGTFLSKAGTVTAINAAAHEITIKDLANNKPLVVKFIPESRVKRMPEAAAPGAPKGNDIVQLLDSLPPIKIEDLKPGDVAVVSAMKGARADQVTAVTFLANAEALVQLAMKARGAGANGPAPSLAGLASSISNVSLKERVFHETTDPGWHSIAVCVSGCKRATGTTGHTGSGYRSFGSERTQSSGADHRSERTGSAGNGPRWALLVREPCPRQIPGSVHCQRIHCG